MIGGRKSIRDRRKETGAIEKVGFVNGLLKVKCGLDILRKDDEARGVKAEGGDSR